jgi:hypothetical protein
MSLPLIGFCIGLIPGLIIALVVSNKCSREHALMRERLAAEEASKRHFMDLATKQEATIALMHQEQKRLEVVLARQEGAPESIAA